MPDLEKTKKNFEAHGFVVKVFENRQQAADYLDENIDATTVGISGSVTVQQLQEGFGDRLSHHNTVYWHWFNAVDTHNAINSEVYITSANGVSETGELVNIEGRGNRVSSMLFGHERLYIVIGVNKIVPTLEDARWRAKNIAAPRNAKRMSDIGVKNGKQPRDLPCVKNPDRCYDCDSPQRICKVELIHSRRPDFIKHAEILIIKEEIGL